MNALDTNVLARFFINDADDPEAAKQRPAAIKALTGAAFVPVSVVLEFEWVMRGFYELSRKDIQRVFESLCGLENVQIEDRGIVHVDSDNRIWGLRLLGLLFNSDKKSATLKS